MGIFSRLFGGGQDGESSEGAEPTGDVVGDGAITASAEAPASTPTPAPAQMPVGSEPTPLPKVDPNMWTWPGSIPVRTSQPPPPAPLEVKFDAKPEKVEKPDVKPTVKDAGRSTGRIPKQPAMIVDSGSTPAPVVVESTQKPRDPTIVSSPPPAVAIESAQKPRDPTLVMSPPPPVASAPAPAAPNPPVVAPARAGLPLPKRGKVDTISSAFDSLVARDSRTKQADGVSTAADLAEVKATFEQVAAVHVAQVRDVMLELKFGGANPAWLEAAKPALQSVRKMAAQMELADLVAALDAFTTALDAAVRTSLADKAPLLRVYDRLVALVPQAFELSAETDRREPIIVEALLLQVDGVERPTIDRLSEVGLGKLETLLAANPGDIAAVTGLRAELAAAIVARFAAYRASGSALAAVDAAGERRQLHDLSIVLSLRNDDFRRAASSWKPDDIAKKRELRKAREVAYQKVRVALARLGERDKLMALDKLPFDDRIALLDKLLSAQLAG